jgi:hypothetical protein
MAARKQHVFQVLTLSSFSGICLLILCLVGGAEIDHRFPAYSWAAASGISGAIGLAFFYYGLSLGTCCGCPHCRSDRRSAAGCLGTFRRIAESLQLAGFILAFLGFGLFHRPILSHRKCTLQFWIAVLAGIFFVVLSSSARSSQARVFMLLLVSRSFELLVAL